ncbi:LIM/homeobox protein Lhx9-like [Homarus americanus]|uniref:LIM/homeobox protein Lhx9-like n=1 Tax=Homarus americanus TaxID=6706 RepID=A0A8J5MLV8_HOMAM|nr:LIM/homeobox protein Lhx9-like [Homarus americanus]
MGRCVMLSCFVSWSELVPGGEMSMDGYRYDHQGPGQNRTKRMRTSFKHHQLRTMKSYFNLNQNPDAKDLKQLAQKTGLSKRVLQVWFQNARAKWRRNILKQEHERHVGDKLKDQSGLLGDLRPVDSLGPGLTDIYAMSSGDEGSQSLQFTDMCQGDKRCTQDTQRADPVALTGVYTLLLNTPNSPGSDEDFSARNVINVFNNEG